MYRRYKNKVVDIIRTFTVDEEWYVDVYLVGYGKQLHKIPLSDIHDEYVEDYVENVPEENEVQDTTENNVIIVTEMETGKTQELTEDDLANFVADNKLNQRFVDLCLQGKTKQHKGFTFQYK